MQDETFWKTSLKTKAVWSIFSEMDRTDLAMLLHEAGIVIPARRADMIAVAVINWYHGSVPNNQTLDELRK